MLALYGCSQSGLQTDEQGLVAAGLLDAPARCMR
eukprot:COSAG05_NODE_21020_length_275_cov_0.585227_1_plen_33_part_10